MTTDLLQVDYFYRATIAQNYIKDVLSQLELIREEFVTYKLFYTEFHHKIPGIHIGITWMLHNTIKTKAADVKNNSIQNNETLVSVVVK